MLDTEELGDRGRDDRHGGCAGWWEEERRREGQREADWVYEARPVFTCMMMTVVTPAPTPACSCQSAPHM